MRKAILESLSADSTVEEFINEISKSVADFIVVNRPAFSSDDQEALQEYLASVSVEDVKDRILSLLEEPSNIDEEAELPENEPEQDEIDQDKSVEQDEEKPASIPSEDMVSPDILSMIDD